MGKGKRLKAMRASATVKPLTPEDWQAYFSGIDEEPITDELIEELSASGGPPREDLLELRKQGANYNRRRNSFVWPAEIDFF